MSSRVVSAKYALFTALQQTQDPKEMEACRKMAEEMVEAIYNVQRMRFGS